MDGCGINFHLFPDRARQLTVTEIKHAATKRAKATETP